MEAQTLTLKTSITVSALSKSWSKDTIRIARKAKGLTQMELALELGCRQQTISEWEMGMYAPKNAYQKLLDQYFSAKEGGVTQDESSFTASIPDLLGTIQYMQRNGLTEIRIPSKDAAATFRMFGGSDVSQAIEAAGLVRSN